MPIPFPLVNFAAAVRKALLIPFGYFSPQDSISWIAGGTYTPSVVTGTVNGSNATFTVTQTITSGVSIFKNGVLQDPATMYTLSGQTVTFNYLFIPQPGDVITAAVF